MDGKKLVKLALVSGASHALKYQRENPQASEEELIQMVSRHANELFAKLDTEE